MRVKGLNDAKYIAAAVYVTSIVTAVIIVSLYSLKTFLNLYAALFGLGFFIGTTVILVLVFVPKVTLQNLCTVVTFPGCLGVGTEGGRFLPRDRNSREKWVNIFVIVCEIAMLLPPQKFWMKRG